jgi:alpha-L-rhamnosidase
MNLSLVFSLRTEFCRGKKYELAITASTAYMAFCGNKMIAAGPARAGHGFYRVDRLKLDPFGAETEADGSGDKVPGEIKVIVAGYNVNAFEYVDMPSFLCAELTEDGKVTGRTAPYDPSKNDGYGVFTARVYNEKIQKIQRYSFQRAFAEAYDYTRPRSDEKLVLTQAEAGTFLERGVRDADFSEVVPEWITCRGAAHIRTIAENERIHNRVIDGPRDNFKCYSTDELEVNTLWEAQGISTTLSEPGKLPFSASEIPAGSFAVIDMGAEFTGMIGIDVEAQAQATMYVFESEILTEDRPDGVDFYRLGDSDVIKWTFCAGKHSLLTFEPYSFRYAKIIVFGADVKLCAFRIVKYSYREITKKLSGKFSPELRKIFDAAVETFRQNAVDIYMDCPSRERAGWLCDSYFTSRTERCLTGESLIERNFLENFLLPDKFRFLPDGMLPMCYPSDHNDGIFIPSWAMWYVLELREYADRTGDRELIDFAKPKIYALLKYFERFVNEFGLLEKLESWVFVEWSKANSLVQDVNFPNNFLYAKVLKDAGEMYGDEKLIRQGEQLVRTASALSFTGSFFCDNAIRRGDKLVLSGECTECCQYYAFYFGAADEATHPELFKIMVNDFGPGRDVNTVYPQIAPANAFIGNYLRLDWLMRIGLTEKVKENILGYFYEMARKTGTLWELMDPVASCNHGFASHVAVWLSAMDE